MNAPVYIDILEKTLLPFIEAVYPDSHMTMTPNTPRRWVKNLW